METEKKQRLERLETLASAALKDGEVCMEWKRKINEALRLERNKPLGTWYKFSRSHIHTFMYAETESSGHGFWRGEYRDEIFGSRGEHWEDMEPEDWDILESLFIKEAKSRGLWEVPIMEPSGEVRKVRKFTKVFNNGTLWSSFGKVFVEGEWATALPVQVIIRNGYTYELKL